jgi:hypothetical protein
MVKKMSEHLSGYLVFAGDVYYPNGGMEDFIAVVDTIDQAKDIISKWVNDNKYPDSESEEGFFDFHWAHIYGVEEQKIVFSR